jgi:hypothetical protein
MWHTVWRYRDSDSLISGAIFFWADAFVLEKLNQL